jgi:hypothetical protein
MKNNIWLSKEQAQVRYNICKTCEHLSSSPMFMCKKCNCFAKLKARMIFTSCPENKWDNETQNWKEAE